MRAITFALLISFTMLEFGLSANSSSQTQEAFTPFTGKTTRNKVRLRAGADLNSPIVRELEKGTLLGIVGQDDLFYSVKPPQDLKVYVYRTYVLDNVVDGTQVNVRLEPSLESPVVAQLNKGDPAQGIASNLNNKWLEITLPETVQLYISKDFVEKAGPLELFAESQARRVEASRLIKDSYVSCQVELQKTPEERQLESPLAELREAVTQYEDLPEETARAQNYLAIIEQSSQQGENASRTPSQESMSRWFPKEAELFEQWLEKNPSKTMDDFYAEGRELAIQLRGRIEPYTRPVKNRPGNFLLINHQDNQPIAFLYSTQVDLQESVGKVVSLVALQRPNHHFAFPAFFVVSAD